ncbi:hypothetical protein LTR40_014734, partial [Exophiala xenobiotica]
IEHERVAGEAALIYEGATRRARRLDTAELGLEEGALAAAGRVGQRDDANASEVSQNLFPFGAGARTCIGKNISYLEMYRLVPAVLRTFD